MKSKEKFYSHITKIRSFINGEYVRYIDRESLLIYYSDFTLNWGDYINPFLIERITGKKVVSSKRVYNISNRKEIFGIGSILKSDLSDAVIWGSGFIKENKSVSIRPHKILALRGKLSAEVFHRSNIDTPKIYGDPALLFPKYFNITPDKERAELGIIPHYSEINHPLILSLQKKFGNSIKVIDPKAGLEKFVSEVLSCDCILSSSLHGLIISDAYSIPNCRFTLTQQIIGQDFKFNDYYSGVGIDEHLKIDLNNAKNSSLTELASNAYRKKMFYEPELLERSLLDYINEDQSK